MQFDYYVLRFLAYTRSIYLRISAFFKVNPLRISALLFIFFANWDIMATFALIYRWIPEKVLCAHSSTISPSLERHSQRAGFDITTNVYVNVPLELYSQNACFQINIRRCSIGKTFLQTICSSYRTFGISWVLSTLFLYFIKNNYLIFCLACRTFGNK